MTDLHKASRWCFPEHCFLPWCFHPEHWQECYLVCCSAQFQDHVSFCGFWNAWIVFTANHRSFLGALAWVKGEFCKLYWSRWTEENLEQKHHSCSGYFAILLCRVFVCHIQANSMNFNPNEGKGGDGLTAALLHADGACKSTCFAVCAWLMKSKY